MSNKISVWTVATTIVLVGTPSLVAIPSKATGAQTERKVTLLAFVDNSPSMREHYPNVIATTEKLVAALNKRKCMNL